MSRLGILLLYVVSVFALGGAIAPWIWWGLKAAVAHAPAGWGWGTQWTDHPFYRYVHRCLLAVALLGLVPFVRKMTPTSSARGVGIGQPVNPGAEGQHGAGSPRRLSRLWLLGVGLGAGMFALALVAEWGLGLREWRTGMTLGRVFSVLASASAAAVAVGVLEEYLFRGVVCRGLSAALGWSSAILVSSGLYAWVHFLGKVPSPDPVQWDSGWKVVLAMLRASVEIRQWMPGMPTLFLAGVFLARLMQRTGNLWMPMGLHSGWVGFIKLRSALTRGGVASETSATPESRISAGWTGLVMVLCFWLAFEFWAARSRQARSRNQSD